MGTTHICWTCSKEYRYQHELSSHFKARHNPEGPAYACEYCEESNAGFATRQGMLYHVRSKHLGFRYECDEHDCKESFTNPTYLKGHKKRAHPERGSQIEYVQLAQAATKTSKQGIH